MSFLGIVGSRCGTGPSATLWQEPTFSLFITIGLTNFCCAPGRSWRGNDNAVIHADKLSLVPSTD